MEHCEDLKLGGLPALRLSLDNGSCAVIIPGLGGTVHSLCLSDGNGAVRELLRSDSEDELLPNRYYRGRFMFPFAGRIPGGRYSWLGREHRFPSNVSGQDLALHGFLYRKPMRVLAMESGAGFSSLRLCLTLMEGEEEGYPFPAEVILSYRLDPRGFSVDFSVQNKGALPIPAGFGWHPYFLCESPLAELSLTMGSEAFVPVDGMLLPTGGLLPVSGTAQDCAKGYLPAAEAAGASRPVSLDTAFYTPRDESVLLDFAPGRAKIRMTADRNAFPYTHLFVPPEEDSIAVEPVSSAANAFNLPALGLRVLQAGSSACGKIRIELE